jgi:hypothetical protein
LEGINQELGEYSCFIESQVFDKHYVSEEVHDDRLVRLRGLAKVEDCVILIETIFEQVDHCSEKVEMIDVCERWVDHAI